MSWVEGLLARPRLALGAAILLSLVGLFAWTQMPRLEDPEMPDRWALVLAPYPGADPFVLERTVVEPIEQALAEVQELKHVETAARSGMAVINLELTDDIELDEIDRIWDDVEDALMRARRELPEGAQPPILDRNTSDPEAILLALTGTGPLALAEAAEQAEKHLLALPQVSRVKRAGDQGRQVTIAVDEAAATQLGVTARHLTNLLGARELTIPAGAIDVGGRTVTLRPEAEYHSVEEIARTPVPLASGAAVPLSDVADVHLGPEHPIPEKMRFNGQTAVGLGVVPARPVDLVRFGEEIRDVLGTLRAELAPVQIHEVTFQPKRVQKRLDELGESLLMGMAVVALVIVLSMGLRLGLVVSAVVPLVAAASLGLYAAAGGVLHQMSIAALVIALGMLVDNAIVVAENVQARIDAGEPSRDATRAAARELALPLGAATGTTVAAFIPMLLAKGPVADFTRALPIVISLTLAVSYMFALAVTPTLARLLRARRKLQSSQTRPGFAAWIGGLAVRRRGWILAGAGAIVAGSVMLAGGVEKQFFPGGDRNQLLVNVTLPEGSTLDRTDRAMAELERALADRPEVQKVASFVGRGAPHFYYNVVPSPHTPHRGQVLVETRDLQSAEQVQRWVRGWIAEHLPQARAVARKLEQGPSVKAPVEVRLYGTSLQSLAEASDQVVGAVRDLPGTRDTRDSMGTGVPSLRVRVDDASAARHGLSRSDVVLALLGQTQGLVVGEMRSGDEPVPILLRAPEGRHTRVEQLDSIPVADAQGGVGLPLGGLARTDTAWQPAVIERRNRSRVASVLAELEDGHTFSQVERELRRALAALDLPAGVRWDLGGASEGASSANDAMLMTLPLGLLVLFGILLLEFNSYRRVAVILSTLPLAAAGVVPGLRIGEQPFGFMSLLGVIALCGVVVNNAIVLLDVADRSIREGNDLEQATREAVASRTRPILLTTVTTVAGLVPLALSPTTLWPPLAWAMISGLIASSGLTLLVVPALYVVLLTPRRWGRVLRAATAASALGLTLPSAASAQTAAEPFELTRALREAGPAMSAEQAVERALAYAPARQAAEARTEAARSRLAARRAALWPTLDLSARYTRLNPADGDPLVDTSELDQARDGIEAVEDPAAAALFTGVFDALEQAAGSQFSSPVNQTELLATLTLPISDILLRLLPAKRAAQARRDAASHTQRTVRADVALRARLAYYRYALALGSLAVAQRAEAQAAAQKDEVEQLEAAGRASEADRMAAVARLQSTRAQRARLEGSAATARVALWTQLGEEDKPLGLSEPERPRLEITDRETLVQQAFEQRPELAATQAARRAQNHAENAERGAMWPQLLAQGSARYANPNLRFLPPEQRFQTSWEVSAVVRWSPNQAATSKRRADALKSDRAATSAELEALADTVRIEVTRAYEDFHAAEQASEAALAAQRAAEEAYRVRRVQFEAGAAVTTDVLEADLAVTRARLAYLQAVLSLRESHARLQRATGKTI